VRKRRAEFATDSAFEKAILKTEPALGDVKGAIRQLEYVLCVVKDQSSCPSGWWFREAQSHGFPSVILIFPELRKGLVNSTVE